MKSLLQSWFFYPISIGGHLGFWPIPKNATLLLLYNLARIVQEVNIYEHNQYCLMVPAISGFLMGCITDSCHLTTRRGQHGALAFGLKILAVSVSGDDIQIYSNKLSWTVFINIYQFLHIFIIYLYKNSQSKLLRINWNIISRHTHCQYF